MTQTVERMLPLYEAKMLDIYDHRNADVVKSETAGKRQNQPRYLSPAEHQDVNREPIPLAWVREELIPPGTPDWLIGFSDITSSTNERTVKSAALPRAGVGNTYPLVNGMRRALILSQTNSFVLDFVARQKVAGLHLNFIYVKQFPLLPPASFERPCPWALSEGLDEWVIRRVVHLSCTSRSMRPMARELLSEGRTFAWDAAEREILMAELDAAMFHLYRIPREDVDYIMETFPIVRRKDEATFGSFRTKELILEVFDAMQEAVDAGRDYRSPLENELA